jgi:hypothetical protein
MIALDPRSDRTLAESGVRRRSTRIDLLMLLQEAGGCSGAFEQREIDIDPDDDRLTAELGSVKGHRPRRPIKTESKRRES